MLNIFIIYHIQIHYQCSGKLLSAVPHI